MPVAPAMDALDAPAIIAALGGRALDVDVIAECPSTNAALLATGTGDRARMLVAGYQSAGRGRRGRRWHSPPGAGITLSIARRMRRPLSALQGLSLAAGAAAARTLRNAGAADVALKWPNDLVARDAKLGGILVETRTDRGAVLAVVGIGVNWRTTRALGARLRRRTIALQALLPALPGRSVVVGHLAGAVLDALELFDAEGLAALRAEWNALHAHAGARVRVRLADGRVVTGIAAGIAGDGALQLRTHRGLRDVHAAQTVTARPALTSRTEGSA